VGTETGNRIMLPRGTWRLVGSEEETGNVMSSQTRSVADPPQPKIFIFQFLTRTLQCLEFIEPQTAMPGITRFQSLPSLHFHGIRKSFWEGH
jgi:hypothetical protein